ncbi:MAG: hypothetical protein LBF78_00205 [Treponema sp.]|jgi:hypothetical protein|nr:hypothetical protein [Treponema sp.]
MRALPLTVLFFMFALSGLPAQEAAQAQDLAQIAAADPAFYIGLNLEELLGRFGPPLSVYALRGLEAWQDDVVFSYAQGEFYILKDRVWQVELKSAYRIKAGDPKTAALLVMGHDAKDMGDHLIAPLEAADWPLSLRCNLDPAGKVLAIFIFRSDL